MSFPFAHDAESLARVAVQNLKCDYGNFDLPPPCRHRRRLAAELVDPTWRDADRPLVQFVMDWRRYPEQRPSVPGWVRRCRLSDEIALFGVPLETAYGHRVRRSSPGVCAAHGVWFSADLLDA